MRTLEQALREHLSCPGCAANCTDHDEFHHLGGHAMSLVYAKPWVELTHHETPATLRARQQVTVTPNQEQDDETLEQRELEAKAAAGSAIFHTFSNALAGEPGHEIVPLEITDEEYASFLEAPSG